MVMERGRDGKREYAKGTFLVVSYPWGIYHGGAAECSDGKVRTLARIAQTADTFFSIPASVKVNGRTVSGYVTIETVEGYSTETVSDPSIVRFVAYSYGKNGSLLPGTTFPGRTRDHWNDHGTNREGTGR